MLEKLENIGFGGCQKLKYEVNNQKKNYNTRDSNKECL